MEKMTLPRWREMDAIVVLRTFADHAKEDLSFHPITSLRMLPKSATCSARNQPLIMLQFSQFSF